MEAEAESKELGRDDVVDCGGEFALEYGELLLISGHLKGSRSQFSGGDAEASELVGEVACSTS